MASIPLLANFKCKNLSGVSRGFEELTGLKSIVLVLRINDRGHLPPRLKTSLLATGGTLESAVQGANALLYGVHKGNLLDGRPVIRFTWNWRLGHRDLHFYI